MSASEPMRRSGRFCIYAAVVLSVGLHASAVTNARAGGWVRLSEIKPFSKGLPTNVWVELQNTATSDVSLVGWRIEDAAGAGFSFPPDAPRIGASSNVVVFFGEQTNAPPAERREGIWFFAPQERGTARFMEGGTTECRLYSLGNEQKTLVDSVRWHQEPDFKQLKMLVLKASEEGDEEEIRALTGHLQGGGKPGVCDDGSSYGRLPPSVWEMYTRGRWHPYAAFETTPGRENPPPAPVFRGPVFRGATAEFFSSAASVQFHWHSWLPVRLQMVAVGGGSKVMLDTNGIDVGWFKLPDGFHLQDGKYGWRVRAEQRQTGSRNPLCSAWTPMMFFVVNSEDPTRKEPQAESAAGTRIRQGRIKGVDSVCESPQAAAY